MPSVQDLLEMNLEGEDWAILSILCNNGEIDLSRLDENTGLLPFMSAAARTSGRLDVVYTLAMRNLDNNNTTI